jgi:mannose-6-phosphate isomerase-like protein (cupin superfamily)
MERRRGLWGLLATAAVAAAAGAGKRLGAEVSTGSGEGKGAGQAFSLKHLAAEQARTGAAWREFLRVPSLSLGVYQLKKGAEDKQTPHKQDEIYYVSSGRAVLEVEGQGFPVETGSVVFVPARARHHFRDIAEDLTTLVFFAPAETE